MAGGHIFVTCRVLGPWSYQDFVDISLISALLAEVIPMSAHKAQDQA